MNVRNLARLLTLALLLPALPLSAQPANTLTFQDCRIALQDGVLTLENSHIRRTFQWKNNRLTALAIEDKAIHHTWNVSPDAPDGTFPGIDETPTQGDISISKYDQTPIKRAHLIAEVTYQVGTLEVKRVFHVYPETPAMNSEYYLRGSAPSGWAAAATSPADVRTFNSLNHGDVQAPVLERLHLNGQHWRLSTVSFNDVTDRHNNLVHRRDDLLYSRIGQYFKGNVFFIQDPFADQGLFLVKAAPLSYAQLGYPGCDFAVRHNTVRVVGIGIAPDEVQGDKWIRCYGEATGVTHGGEFGRLQALRAYENTVRRRLPDRDEMILLNTWGDRSQGTKLGESFAIAELKAGARLGITHFQLDAGWQLSIDLASDSLFKTDSQKFPGGLQPVVDEGKSLGITVGLWTDPGRDYDYNHWENFPKALLAHYRRTGIRNFKFDGVNITHKEGEVRIRKMLDTVMEGTGDQAVFNLDITNHPRYGYFYFGEYGNYFLENRYTDWVNYYPHFTLRNLWMLSKYVPAQKLQIEFLNKWRNADLYAADDPLAPSRVPFDYIFAITMMGQPLAWFEATGLPQQAFDIAPLVKTYQKKYMWDIHQGLILPVGEEPSGTGWTGFQSLHEDEGYLLVFREWNQQPEHTVHLWDMADKTVTCTALLGHGKDFTAQTDADGAVTFQLPGPYTWALYKYTVTGK